MSRRNLAWLLIVPGAVLLGLVVTAAAPPKDDDYRRVRDLVDVLAEVDRHYVRELTPDQKKKLIEDMINGGLERLDPHSAYFNAEERERFESDSEGQFSGVGIMLARDPGSAFLKVQAPLPGTPAYDAGVRADDLILRVKSATGEASTEGMTIDEARRHIMGKAGTQVTLTLRGDGEAEPRDVTLTRATIVSHPVSGVRRDPADPTKWDYLLDPGAKIGYVRLSQFNEKAVAELRDAVKQLEAAGAKGLVLDLRENPGGLLDQAIEVSNLFLTAGEIVSTGDLRGPDGAVRKGRSWTAEGGKAAFEPAGDRPMAVLVNRGSASASEIVAAALQDHKRAVVVGERSYGKGSVQKVYSLPDSQAALKLTSEVWFRPNGQNIHKWPDSKDADPWGVKPDDGFEVKTTDEERRQLAVHVRSLDAVRGKPGVAKDGPKPEPPKPFEDAALKRAVEHLRGKLTGMGEAPGAAWRRAA